MDYTIVYEPNRLAQPSAADLKQQLEKGSDEDKVAVMATILTQMLNGDPLPGLLMHIIRFVMPSRSKALKKMLYFYWEVVPKLGPDGKLKQEMILVCNAIRNDLQHPNEFIRGATLRFLTKIREQDLLEPLIPTVRQCLENRHAYVRKNAVFTVLAIAQHSDILIPDAAELLAAFLEAENDGTCRRNAFVALAKLDRDAAYGYFTRHYTEMGQLSDGLQLAFIEFIRKDATTHPDLTASYSKILAECLSTASNMVAYDAAAALAALSPSPTQLAAAAAKYVALAVAESDNNIKMVALRRVQVLNARAPGSLGGLVMDVLLVLSSPDVDVRKQALELAMALVTSRSVDGVVRLLKRELAATVQSNYDKNAEYRQAVIAAIHKCAVRFSNVTTSVVSLLLDFLGDFNTDSAVEVVKFIKEVLEVYPKLRREVIGQLLASLNTIRSSSVYLGVLWVLGEYCTDEHDIKKAWIALREALGPLPIQLDSDESADNAGGAGDDNGDGQPKPAAKPKVLADGTYATETAFDSVAVEKRQKYPLRHLILEGKYFMAGALASTLTKLVLRASDHKGHHAHANGMRAEALLAMTSILRVGEAQPGDKRIDADSFDRIYSCIQVLVSHNPELERAFIDESHKAFEALMAVDRASRKAAQQSEQEKTATAVDRPVDFRLLGNLSLQQQDDPASELIAAPPTEDKLTSQLKHIYQLTGFSDPIYAEAHMKVSHHDITLDVMLFNQTTETLQNLAVEFYTVGELTVVDRPPPANVPPMSFHTVQATIRVKSIDAAVIFGNIVYEGKSSSEATYVILHDIRLNILDYVRAATCTEQEFRDMWSAFEWENKITISRECRSLPEFLKELMAHTNMGCLTTAALDESGKDCQFLSANLYARSTFGEDALANISVEKRGDKVVGALRIRANTQGPALSIGDRVTDMRRK